MKIKTSKEIRKMNMEQVDKYETQLLRSGEYVPAVVKEHMRALWIKKYGKVKQKKQLTSIPKVCIVLTIIIYLYGFLTLMLGR